MDLTWLWSRGGGGSLFDPYSLYHFIFFIALTLIFYPVFTEHILVIVLALAFIWEILEYWINENFSQFPYVGHESVLNKVVGDPISNLLGFLVAMYLIGVIRKKEHERIEKTCLEKDRKDK